MVRPIKCFLVVIAWLCSTASATTLDESGWARAYNAAAVRAAISHIDALVRDGQGRRLAHAIASAELDQSLPVAQREAILAHGAVALSAFIDTAGDHVLARLAQRPVRVWVRRQHDGHTVTVPAFDTPAAARWAQHQRRIERAARAAGVAVSEHRALKAADFSPAAKIGDGAAVPSDHIIAPASARAMQRADPARLVTQRVWLSEQLGTTPALAAAALVVAIRLQDAQLLSTIIATAPQDVALNAVQKLALLPPHDGFDGPFEAALQRDATASAALLALGNWAGSEPAAVQRLLKQLEHPTHGASAAAALARADSRAIALQLADRLDATDQPLLGARLALALSLMQNDVAIERLQRFANADGPLLALKAKLLAVRPGERP